MFLACKAANLDTNVMIQKLDRIYLRHGLSNSYYDVKMLNNDHKTLFAAFNILPADFEKFAAEVNKRLNTPISNNVYLLPEHESTPVKVSKPRGRGRPPGSKNKKTLEKEAAIKAMILSGIDSSVLIPPKNPIGRPKDRKDSKPRKRRTKAEIEADRAAKENMEKDKNSNN